MKIMNIYSYEQRDKLGSDQTQIRIQLELDSVQQKSDSRLFFLNSWVRILIKPKYRDPEPQLLIAGRYCQLSLVLRHPGHLHPPALGLRPRLHHQGYHQQNVKLLICPNILQRAPKSKFRAFLIKLLA